MARPQTDGGVESSGQSGQQSCRMEALRPEGARQDAWHGSGFHALQMGYQPCHPRRDIATQTAYSAVAHSPRPTPACVPSSPPSETAGAAVRESADTGREQGSSVERPRDGQPLPDLLPQRQRPLGEPAVNSSGSDQEIDDDASGRVADQLRIIGDELNALFLQRRNAVQPLQDWRGLCWGLFTLITDTLSTLYVRRNR
ncbi:bcl-2-binding component 3 [Anguilla anguilla]|uniref:BCL2 binding component 3 n=1 Tax=Anguilla anguilla TaxID=7936 RepID=A0A9D3LW51_ANGAN|nr:bcl-2-binding component 3 [Anguilla anguilla]XP_035242473.1 bcl-2-binding component 3 [Anguilla anguilla]KAG5837322.1 hypothetical protein ANANG_G00238060 [Anguilla anguilla]